MPPGREPRRPSLFARAPLSLLIIASCLLVFIKYNVAAQDQGRALLSLTFSPANGLLFPGIVTHMFAHGDMGHLLVNMIVLFFLGVIVEIRYGTPRYALLYFASGLLAALAQALFAPAGFLLGASGALAGVMGAFVRHYPKERLYLYGILPMPAWLLLTGWMLFNIYGASYGGAANIAFIAHIAGFVAGISLSLLIEPPGRTPRGRPWPGTRR
ncbi:MAG TPA: rhomboid family intramembrane serine protease [Firmicutes bacterium]|nr:rhomboid family intramembrane serine protease [Bacillota bacterium]